MEWISIKEQQPYDGQICRIKTIDGIEAIASYMQNEDEPGGEFSYTELDKVRVWWNVRIGCRIQRKQMVWMTIDQFLALGKKCSH
jgi:hypothetical protein